jgi:beta-glucosidase
VLTDVLRGKWGFDRLVVSDWGAVFDRVAALEAGLDLEMPPNSGSATPRLSILSSSADSTRRCSMPPPASSDWSSGPRARTPAEIDVAAPHALARRAAGRGIVPLKTAATYSR